MTVKIDPKVEPLVRQVLDAAVKQDFKRFSENLKSFKTDEAATEGLDLAVRICWVLVSRRHDGPPSPEQRDRLAESVAESETAWSSLGVNEIREALEAIVDNRPARGLDDDPALAIAPFILAAFLLAGMTQKPKWWFETLNEIEAILEQQ